jgi:hypothetical protein
VLPSKDGTTVGDQELHYNLLFEDNVTNDFYLRAV